MRIVCSEYLLLSPCLSKFFHLSLSGVIRLLGHHGNKTCVFSAMWKFINYHFTFASIVHVGSKVFKWMTLLHIYLSTPMQYHTNKKMLTKIMSGWLNEHWVESTLSVDIIWLERRYGILVRSSERWICNDHFGMSFVTSYCRIMWKIILKIFEEANKNFIEIV